MRVRLSKPVAIVSLLVASLVIGGIAFAYWTTTGSGTGSATTGTAASVVVKQTGTPTGLYPGGSSALSGTFDNPNTGAVFVTAVTASVTPFSVQADTGKPACTQADFSITGTAPVAANVPAGTTVGAWTGLTLNMTNSATNQDNCKSITVPITYAAS